MTSAFAYLRVSGRGQIDGDGFTRQREAIGLYAVGHGISIVKDFQDAFSGTKELADREGMSALFNSLSAEVRLVLVERADRLARDLMISEVILAQFRDMGATVIECEGGSDLTVADGDPTRKLIRQILGAVAEFDKACIVTKLKAARDRIRKAHGRCEGRKPFGYREGEELVIERIRLYRAGGHGFADIARILNREQLPTRTGKPWSRSTVKAIVDRAAELQSDCHFGSPY